MPSLADHARQLTRIIVDLERRVRRLRHPGRRWLAVNEIARLKYERWLCDGLVYGAHPL